MFAEIYVYENLRNLKLHFVIKEIKCSACDLI